MKKRTKISKSISWHSSIQFHGSRRFFEGLRLWLTWPVPYNNNIPGLIHRTLKTEQIEKLISMITGKSCQEKTGEL
jgi:hypothetical protein